MLAVSPIMNVNGTPNVGFGSGVQTNYGICAPSPKNNLVEGGLLTGFVGTVSPSFHQIQSRAKNIEQNLDKSKLNYFA